MHRDAIVAPAETDFGEFLGRPENRDRMLHVVVARGNHIAGVLRVNNALHRGGVRARAGETLGDMASPEYTIAREQEVVSDVIRRLWRRKGMMAVVVRGDGVPRAADVVGVLTKEHVADSVAASIEIYPR
jgi:chloride channel protein, CIC family